MFVIATSHANRQRNCEMSVRIITSESHCSNCERRVEIATNLSRRQETNGRVMSITTRNLEFFIRLHRESSSREVFDVKTRFLKTCPT